MSELDDLVQPDQANINEFEQNSLKNNGTNVRAGVLLREARESAGLHIAALAVLLKVPVKKLEALESGRFDLLPDAVFARALASSVCRTLKIDAGPVLDLFPKTSQPILTGHSSGINMPFRPIQQKSRSLSFSSIPVSTVICVVALLFGALLLVFLPVLKTVYDEIFADKNYQNEKATEVIVLPADVSANAGVVALAKIPASAVSEGENGLVRSTEVITRPDGVASANISLTSPVATVMVPPASSSAFVTPALSGLPQASASAAVITPVSGVLVLRAINDSWVEVTDAKRQIVLRRILTSGEVVGVSGVLPLAAIVGRADATKVEIRGKPLDLSALAKDNVARFEVR